LVEAPVGINSYWNRKRKTPEKDRRSGRLPPGPRRGSPHTPALDSLIKDTIFPAGFDLAGTARHSKHEMLVLLNATHKNEWFPVLI
jgi:hypothetical protein